MTGDRRSCTRRSSRPRRCSSSTRCRARTRSTSRRRSAKRCRSPASCSPSSTATRAAAPRCRCASVTGKPIKFVGVGEKLDGLEPFHPERMAARILGMGDIAVAGRGGAQGRRPGRGAEARREDQDAARASTSRTSRARSQQMKKMGGLASLDRQAAGAVRAGGRAARRSSLDDRALRRIEGIINSMTPAERAKPEIIKASRKRRIAAGAGVPVQEVNRLLNQFEQMQKMMKTDAKRRSRQDDAGDERRLPRGPVAAQKALPIRA